MSRPLLSFCIPTYQRAKTVHACVQHILRHSSDEIDVVVSDNASTDDTIKRLAEIRDPRLSVFSNARNLGYSANFAAAVKHAGGRFAMVLSDEDRIHLDQIENALSFLRAVDPTCAVVRFSMDGVMSMEKGYYQSPAGPESFLFSLLYCGDVAGNAYSRDVIGEPNVERYVTDIPFLRNYSCMDLLFGPSVKHSMYFCPIVLIDRRFEDDIFDEGLVIIEDQLNLGLDAHTFSPPMAHSCFCTVLDRAIELYGKEENADALYGWMAKFFAAYFAFVPTIDLYMHNGGWTDLKYRHKEKLCKRFFDAWGTPWNIVCYMLDNCLATLEQRIGTRTWSSINEIWTLYRDDNLYAPVERYAFHEKFIAGDLLCMTGIDSTIHGYFPNERENFIAAEFTETDKIYRLFQKGRFDDVVTFKKLNTGRDRFFRGAACLMRNRLDEAERFMRSHIDAFTEGKSVRDIVCSQQTFAQAHYLLGLIRHARRDYGEATKWMAKSEELAQKYLLRSYFSINKFERFIPPSFHFSDPT